MRPSCWHQNFRPSGLSAPGQGLCLNFFSSITADFNISSAFRWAIQDQWSSGFQNITQYYFCQIFSQEGSRKSNMVICTHLLIYCVAYIYHDINTSVLCSNTFKSIKMVTFFSETPTNRLNSGNRNTLIAVQNGHKWLLPYSWFSKFSRGRAPAPLARKEGKLESH